MVRYSFNLCKQSSNQSCAKMSKCNKQDNLTTYTLSLTFFVKDTSLLPFFFFFKQTETQFRLDTSILLFSSFISPTFRYIIFNIPLHWSLIKTYASTPIYFLKMHQFAWASNLRTNDFKIQMNASTNQFKCINLLVI